MPCFFSSRTVIFQPRLQMTTIRKSQFFILPFWQYSSSLNTVFTLFPGVSQLLPDAQIILRFLHQIPLNRLISKDFQHITSKLSTAIRHSPHALIDLKLSRTTQQRFWPVFICPCSSQGTFYHISPTPETCYLCFSTFARNREYFIVLARAREHFQGALGQCQWF